jgi:multidrug resistance efflux pump
MSDKRNWLVERLHCPKAIRRWILPVGGLAVVSAVMLDALAQPTSSAAEQTTGQDASPVAAGSAQVDSSQPASLRIEKALLTLIRNVSVPSEVSGLLGEVLVEAGQRVAQGEVLMAVRDNQAQQAVRETRQQALMAGMRADSNLAIIEAEKTLAVASNELNRVLGSNERFANTYTVNEVDRCRLTFERSEIHVLQARLEQQLRQGEFELAEIRHEMATEQLRRHRVLAPWDGWVVSVEAQLGQWVEPGMKLLQLVDTSMLRIEGFIGVEHSDAVLRGAVATVYPVGSTDPATALTGTVILVHPEVNPISRQAKILIDVDNRRGDLRPGGQVDVELVWNAPR